MITMSNFMFLIEERRSYWKGNMLFLKVYTVYSCFVFPLLCFGVEFSFLSEFLFACIVCLSLHCLLCFFINASLIGFRWGCCGKKMPLKKLSGTSEFRWAGCRLNHLGIGSILHEIVWNLHSLAGVSCIVSGLAKRWFAA